MIDSPINKDNNVYISHYSIYDLTKQPCIEWLHDPFEEPINESDPEANALHERELEFYSTYHNKGHIIRLGHCIGVEEKEEYALPDHPVQLTFIDDVELDIEERVIKEDIRVINMISDLYPKPLRDSEDENRFRGVVMTRHCCSQDHPFFYSDEYVAQRLAEIDAIRACKHKDRLVVSNVCWDNQWEDFALDCLRRLGIKYLQISVAKYVDWDDPQITKKLRAIREKLETAGFAVYSIQSTFFSKPHNMTKDFTKFIDHFAKVAGCAKLLGAQCIVFGAGQTRHLSHTKEDQYITELNARKNYELSMKAIADLAKKHADDLFVTIEPVPPEYGANYLHTVADVCQLVNDVQMPNFFMTYDTGNAEMLNELDIPHIPDTAKIGHIQIGEPHHKPLKDAAKHNALGNQLAELISGRNLRNIKISMEQRSATKRELWESLKTFVIAYGNISA